LRNFWLIFAGLGVFAMGGLITYNQIFVEDTPATNRLAWRVMLVVYIVLAVLGIWYFSTSLMGDEVSYKTLVQAVIMLVIGGGGIAISLKHRGTL
jgi:hypothetical protein